MTQTFFLRLTTNTVDEITESELLKVLLYADTLPEKVRKIELAEVDFAEILGPPEDRPQVRLTGGAPDA